MSNKQPRLFGVPVGTYQRRMPGRKSFAFALDLYRILSVDEPDGADTEQNQASMIGRVQGTIYLCNDDYAKQMTPDDYEAIGVDDHHMFSDRTTAVIETIPVENTDEIMQELPELCSKIYHCRPTRTVILSQRGA